MKNLYSLFSALILLSLLLTACSGLPTPKATAAVSSHSNAVASVSASASASASTNSDPDYMPWKIYPQGSDKWYIEKYIDPYDTAFMHTDFDSSAAASAYPIDYMVNLVEISFDKYRYVDVSRYDKGGRILIPQDVMENEIRRFLDVKEVDRTKFAGYNARQKAYDITGYGFGNISTFKITQKQQSGDLVTLRVDISTTDVPKPFQTQVFRLRGSNGNYKYVSVKTVWKLKTDS